VSLGSVLRVALIILPESLFLFISACALCYTLRFSLSLSLYYVHILMFIYFCLFSMKLHCMFCEALSFYYLSLLPDPVDATGLCFFFSHSLLILSCLLCIGCCPLLNLQCLPIVAQFER
jgi:hypothetical protein